ncbi:MAG: hypothetical protein IK111_05390 [Lachnospiraceae bacterium]|nr:hypothetical protein [Lachnospiraceae bacterium]
MADKRSGNGESLIIPGIIVFVLGLALAFFYIFTREIVVYNIDHTDSLFWAAASVDGGSIINRGYWYVYIIPFSGSLLMIPLVKLLGVTYLAHELGMSLFVVVMAVALLFGLRALKLSWGKAFLTSGAMLLIMNISQNTRVIFFGHVIHYSLALVFTFVSFIMLDKTDCLWAGKFDLKQRISYVLLVVWCFLCCLNGSSSILLFLLPLTGALVLERLLDRKDITFSNIKVPLLRLIVVLFGAGLGFLYKRYRIAPYFDNSYEEKFSSLLAHQDWMWKEQGFIVRFVTLLTGDVYAGVPMLSMDGLFIVIRLVFGLLLLIIPVIALFFYKKYENRLMRILLLDYWILFALTWITYGISVVSNTNWRLCTLLGMAFIVSMCFLYMVLKEKYFMRFGYAALCIVIPALLTIPMTVYKLPTDPELNGYVRMAHVLDEHGLTYGYSDMWGGADVMNVLTDSRIKISMISYGEDGDYSITRYQSQWSWYEDQPGVDRYFAVVPDDALDRVKDTLVANAVEKIPFEDSTILVFNENIFKEGRPVYANE